MAIKGSLKEATLPDVIQLLFLGRRTGCLALADRHNFGTIHFDEGHIIYAAIVNRRECASGNDGLAVASTRVCVVGAGIQHGRARTPGGADLPRRQLFGRNMNPSPMNSVDG